MCFTFFLNSLHFLGIFPPRIGWYWTGRKLSSRMGNVCLYVPSVRKCEMRHKILKINLLPSLCFGAPAFPHYVSCWKMKKTAKTSDFYFKFKCQHLLHIISSSSACPLLNNEFLIPLLYATNYFRLLPPHFLQTL